MKKTLFLITIIAFAACSREFLGDLKKNYEKAKEEFEVQQRKLQRLQAKAEQLQDLAAEGEGADAEVIVETINGLTEAAKFWGSFVGNEVFNKAELTKKISELHDKRAQLEKYASETGMQAMQDLNQAIWQIDVTIKSIHSLAYQLKKGAKNVQTISRIAFKNGGDMLEGRDLTIYEAAIRVLVNTLKSANENCAQAATKLDELASKLIAIDTTMTATAATLKATANGKSREFENWKKDMRAKVYGGCTASILTGPIGVAACYSIGAGILESEIAKYKREVEAFKNDFNRWASTFTDMATMANQASTVSKNWFHKVTSFKDEVQSQYDLIQGVQDILWMDQELRQMISDNLETLIVECDKIINDTTGMLEGDEVQSLNAELEMNSEFPELTNEQLKAQAKAVCKGAYKTPEEQAKCVKESLVRMSNN